MKNLKNNKAITLIALIITVIIMMILAGVTVYLAFNGGGLIEKVRQVSIVQELKEVEEQIMLRIEEERLNKFSNNEKFNISDYTSLESFSPKIESKYSEYIGIDDGKMYIKTNAPEEVKKVAEKIGIQIKDRINNIRIYGNSIQNGIPSPENPVEIQSVGDLVTDKNDPNYGKYKISIKASGKNLIESKEIYKNETYYTEIIEDDRNCIRFIDNLGVWYTEYPFKENTQYTVQFDCKSINFKSDNKSNSNTFAFKYSDGTTSRNTIRQNEDWHSITFTSDKGKTVVAVGTESINYVNYVYIDKDTFQLEEGDTATAYEPYVEPVATNIYLDEPLRKVGDVADYIDFKQGKIIRKSGAYTYTGLENYKYHYVIYEAFTNVVRFSSYTGDFTNKPLVPMDSVILSNYLPNAKGFKEDKEMIFVHSYTDSHIYYSFNKSILGLTSDDDNTTIITKLKTYLNNLYINNNPFRVYYSLATPTEESIDLPNISTLSGMKNVSVKTQIQPSKIDVVM